MCHWHGNTTRKPCSRCFVFSVYRQTLLSWQFDIYRFASKWRRPVESSQLEADCWEVVDRYNSSITIIYKYTHTQKHNYTLAVLHITPNEALSETQWINIIPITTSEKYKTSILCWRTKNPQHDWLTQHPSSVFQPFLYLNWINQWKEQWKWCNSRGSSASLVTMCLSSLI